LNVFLNGRLAGRLRKETSGAIDFQYNPHLAALGLPTARTAISELAGRRVLAVRRFDCQWTRDKRLPRIPQDDCCQALSVPPVRKYQTGGGPGIRQILQFLKASENQEDDQGLFITAQIVFWLLGATDGHPRNFSICLYPGGRFRLTPLYDVMSTQPLMDAKRPLPALAIPDCAPSAGNFNSLLELKLPAEKDLLVVRVEGELQAR
jgi:serine/threonine protein kinase HipA of HipAB toxin-antitoxin module